MLGRLTPRTAQDPVVWTGVPPPTCPALVYAQPLSRVVRLTIDDVIHDGDQILLRLGDPPSPLPAPVAGLLLTWIDNRDNMNTATNHHSR